MTDCYTDNAVPVHVTAAQGELSSGTATSTNSYFQQVWKQAFQGIRRCNIGLENIDKVNMDKKKQNVFRGEIYFLRGFFYATLLKLYGGVPLLKTTLSFSDPIPSRSSEEDVYNFIISDLDSAATLLPITQEEVGRATKGAAIAEKAIISNFMNKYKEAAKYAKELITLGIYDLHPNYAELFLPTYENNVEVIFDRQYMDCLLYTSREHIRNTKRINWGRVAAIWTIPFIMVCVSAYHYYSAKDYVKETLSEVTYMQRYAAMGTREEAVSYTHLDVYKRQLLFCTT